MIMWLSNVTGRSRTSLATCVLKVVDEGGDVCVHSGFLNDDASCIHGGHTRVPTLSHVVSIRHRMMNAEMDNAVWINQQPMPLVTRGPARPRASAAGCSKVSGQRGTGSVSGLQGFEFQGSGRPTPYCTCTLWRPWAHGRQCTWTCTVGCQICAAKEMSGSLVGYCQYILIYTLPS